MNAKCKRNRMFGTCILLMMTVLAVCTAVFAAEGESSSYSLIIEKVFDFTSIESDPKLSQDAKEDFKSQARNQEYTFKISGTRIDGGKTVKVDETFTLPQKENGVKVWHSQTYTSNGPFDVMVTELTDNIEITDQSGNHYNMSDSSSDTSISVNSRKYEMQLRNNATIKIERPTDDGSSNNSQELWYRVTNRPYDGHSNNNFEPLDMVFLLAAGEKKEIKESPSGDILRAAIYTIEQVAAPDGYQLQMGTREETVSKDNGGVGHFHINGTPGMLTLTAGGSKGDGATHYYVIERTEMDEEDTSEFVPRTVPVSSGENYILHNLPRGGYTVSEYTIAAGEAFKVTVPETEERTRTEKSSGLTNGTSNSWKYMDLNDLDFDVDYIKMVSFGPLYNSSGNKLNSTTSYAVFRYGIASDDGKLITNIKTYSKSDGFKGNISYTVSDASEIKLNKTKRLYFTATGVKSSTAKKIGVSWIEYDVKETEKTFKSADKAESVTVDDRKWIRIEAPALGDPNAAGADQVAYYYTIKDQNGNLVPGTTDREDTTVKLKPGSGAELELPEAGSYTIAESVVGNSPVGFTMKIEGYPFGTTEADKEIEVQVGGERTVTISKPALINPPDGANDNRDYIFNVTGTDFSEKVIIKAGESKTVTLPKAGKYTVRPEKDTLGTYHLNYVDSGAVYGTASGSTGTVTFTNFFSVGEYGYRYIHEYYVKDEDGSYSYEGNSQITTRLGRSNVDEIHDAAGIRKAPIFNENNYEHFDEAYGRVDPITISPIWEEPSLKSDEGEEPETSEEDNPESGENEETETPDEDNPESDKDGEPDTSGEDSPESDKDGEPDTSGEDSPESDKDGEPDTPKEDSSDSDKEEEPEFPGEDNSGSAEGEGTELSGEDSPESDKNEKPESSDEDVSSPAENGEPVLFSEDFQNNDEDTGADHSDEAGLNPAENGELGDSDENNTDNPDSDGGEEPEIPNEDDPASNEDKDPETSEKDGPDSSENEDQDVPDEDSLDSSKDKEPISSEEDNPKLNRLSES